MVLHNKELFINYTQWLDVILHKKDLCIYHTHGWILYFTTKYSLYTIHKAGYNTSQQRSLHIPYIWMDIVLHNKVLVIYKARYSTSQQRTFHIPYTWLNIVFFTIKRSSYTIRIGGYSSSQQRALYILYT